MGWRFTATDRVLKPSKFWGLTRASLKPVFKEESKGVCQEQAESSSQTEEETRALPNETNPLQYDSSI